MSDQLIVGAVVLALGLLAGSWGWAFKQLWATKPNHMQVAKAIEIEIDRATAMDKESDTAMLESIRTEIRQIREIRNEDHQLLLEIYRMVRNAPGNMP